MAVHYITMDTHFSRLRLRHHSAIEVWRKAKRYVWTEQTTSSSSNIQNVSRTIFYLRSLRVKFRTKNSSAVFSRSWHLQLNQKPRFFLGTHDTFVFVCSFLPGVLALLLWVTDYHFNPHEREHKVRTCSGNPSSNQRLWSLFRWFPQNFRTGQLFVFLCPVAKISMT